MELAGDLLSAWLPPSISMSISYELAKQLNDAGFPQELTLWAFYQFESDTEHRLATNEMIIDKEINPNVILEIVAAPTLEELIEACGERFWRLEYRTGYWEAAAYGKEMVIHSKAKTPTEAAATLWLALNTK